MLGALAPSPALSAKREEHLRVMLKKSSVLRTLVRARAPALPAITGSFQRPTDFLGKAPMPAS